MLFCGTKTLLPKSLLTQAFFAYGDLGKKSTIKNDIGKKCNDLGKKCDDLGK